MNTSAIEARYYSIKDGAYRCSLCPNRCRIAPGKRGICGSRLGTDKGLIADNYGQIAALHIDPMEKKPLYHFHPGEEVISVGGWGCNLGCLHCQNYSLSDVRDGRKSSYISPEELVTICRRENIRNLAFTYNEPTIMHEYAMDVADLADGLDLIYVTNGYICPEPLEEVCEHISAMNLDVKAFTDDFYRKIAKGRLEPVLQTGETVYEKGVHLEITYLLIPTMNDDEKELKAFCEWLIGLSEDIPVHFTAYHRDHLMHGPPDTRPEDLLKAFDIAHEIGLRYVYLGNLPLSTGRDTVCPYCGSVAISRIGFRVSAHGLRDGRCASCGRKLNMRV